MMGWSVTIMTLVFEVTTSIAAARLHSVALPGRFQMQPVGSVTADLQTT